MLEVSEKTEERKVFAVETLGEFQDNELSGPRDTVARWVNSVGVETTAIVLALFDLSGVPGSGDQTAWLATDKNPSGTELPPFGSAISLGDGLASWDSKWLDLGMVKEKRGYWLDIYSVPQPAGVLRLKIFVDHNLDTPQIGGDDAPIYLDMTEAFDQILLEGQFRHVKVRLERDSLLTLDGVTDPGIKDNAFEVTHLVFRAEEKQLS